MADFPRFFRRCLVVPLTVLFLCSCERDDTAVQPSDNTLPVPVAIGFPETRAFANGQGHHVNRILLLPFQKSAENLTNDDANFVPVYNYAQQLDVAQFPVSQAKLYLPSGRSYKVLVIGYNQTDYDFKNSTSPANLFSIGSVSTPVTLANFHLATKLPTTVPEFFTCIAQAYLGAVNQGPVFKPEQNYTLQGTLNRQVSGISIAVTNIPAFVKSITLRAENLVKSIRATDATATQWQATGDGGNRIFSKKTPSGGTVTFSHYLLPTGTTHKTGLFLDIELGTSTQTYTVKTTNGAVFSGNKFIFNPNQAINLTGDYTVAINIGFGTTHGIDLDDDRWDGIH